MYPDCSAMGLIETSLATKETSWHGYRYLFHHIVITRVYRSSQRESIFAIPH